MTEHGIKADYKHDYSEGSKYQPRHLATFAERGNADGVIAVQDPFWVVSGPSGDVATDGFVKIGIADGAGSWPDIGAATYIKLENGKVTANPGIVLNPTTTTLAPDTKGSLMYDSGTDELKYWDGAWQIVSAGGLSSHALDGAYHTATGLTVGWVISADSPTTFSWKAPTGGGTDDDAIHDNVSNEITAITPKTALGSTDEFVLEDGGASFVKKAVTFANIESSISLANLGTRTHASLSDAPADAHHVAFVLADFTTAFAAESLANLTTRAHSDLSDAPTSAHHVRYADSEAESVITAELVDGQSIDLAIDSLISDHAGDGDAHHALVTVGGAPLTLSGQAVTFNYDNNHLRLTGNYLQVGTDTPGTDQVLTWVSGKAEWADAVGGFTGTQWTIPVFDTETTINDSMLSQDAGGTTLTVDGDITSPVNLNLLGGTGWVDVRAVTAQDVFISAGNLIIFRDVDDGDAWLVKLDTGARTLELGSATDPITLTIRDIAAGVSDYDKFLVSDSGVVKFRTGAEVAGDIGAATAPLALTDLASYVQGSIIIGGDVDWEALAAGTEDYVLKMGAAEPAWGQVDWSELTGSQPAPISHNFDVHTGDVDLVDIAGYAQGSIIKGGASDWGSLVKGTENYVLKAGATDIAWGTVDWSELTGTQPAPVAHNLIDTTGHPVSALTGGHFLKALTTTTYGFAAHGLGAGDVGAYTTAEVDSAIDTDITTHTSDDNAHHEVFESADFTTAFAAESLANLTTRTHSDLSDAPEDAHHTKIHNLIDTTNHPVAGLNDGHFLKADSATTYSFQAHGLTASDVGAAPAFTETQYKLAMFDTTTTIGDSMVSQNSGGTLLTIGGDVVVSGGNIAIGTTILAARPLNVLSNYSSSTTMYLLEDQDATYNTVFQVKSAHTNCEHWVISSANWWKFGLLDGTSNFQWYDETGDVLAMDLTTAGALSLANSLTIGSIAAGVADYDAFLVSDSGLIKFRTGAEVLSDLAAYTSAETDSAIDTDITTHAGDDNAHHAVFTSTDFTTAFAAESLANLTTRAHSDLSDAPTSAHHVRYADSEAIAAVVAENPLALTNAIKIGGNSIEDSTGAEMIGFTGAGFIDFFGGQGTPSNQDVLAWSSANGRWEVQAQSGGGGITGSGTANVLTKWLVGGSTIQDSIISDDGSIATVGGALTVSGALKAGGDGFDIDASGNITDITVAAATVDTDRFIVQDGSQIKYRTGAQVLGDISAMSKATTYVQSFWQNPLGVGPPNFDGSLGDYTYATDGGGGVGCRQMIPVAGRIRYMTTSFIIEDIKATSGVLRMWYIRNHASDDPIALHTYAAFKNRGETTGWNVLSDDITNYSLKDLNELDYVEVGFDDVDVSGYGVFTFIFDIQDMLDSNTYLVGTELRLTVDHDAS